MKLSVKRILFKTFKIAGITMGSILLLMFLLPYLFPDTVSKKIKEWANSSINGELNFSKVRLSFFNHFPSLTLALYDLSLKGSAPFQKDTLVVANEVALGIDLWSVFSQKINIDELYLTGGKINIEVNKEGDANYNVYISDTTNSSANSNDSSSASLKIEKIQMEHSNVVYDDQSIPMLITAKEVTYTGEGDLSKAIFDLSSHMQVHSFDLDYDNMHYIGSKKLNADLITKINTQSLAFIFEKNDLRINSLPVRLKGKFEFLENGYNMDFEINSEETNLHDVFTVLPSEYLHWLDSTEVKGYTQIAASLKGRYITETNTMPDLKFNMSIRDGYIANKNTPSPVKNLFLNFESALPSLNPDSLYVNIDSIFFNIDKDYFSSVIKIAGLNRPSLHAKINAEIDLAKWDKAFGLSSFDVKGKYNLHFTADGSYAESVVQKGLRRKDTIITSIPQFDIQSSLNNGYFKYASLPQAINNISFNLNASCADSNYHHAKISLENLNATALSNYIKGYFKLSGENDLPVEAKLQSLFHLSDIKQFYPLDSMDVNGDLNVDIQSKGKYNPAKKLFPVTKATINLQNGSLQTKYYLHPVEKIQVNAMVTNSGGTMKELNVDIQPFSFEFEGQPFQLKADLQNFDNLKYNITSHGIIDIGKIYKVFAQQGYDAKGFVQTNLSLRGLQSDATAGSYDKLFNSGTLNIKDNTLSSDLFPQPFKITTGLFRFNQDKIWFDQFKASYGKTKVSLNGYLSNVINYALKENEPLRGHFDLKTDYFLVDEFMAFAETDTSNNVASDNTETGVIIVPSNLAIHFIAAANKVAYNGLDIRDFKGEMSIDSSTIKLKQTGFTLINAPVTMDASYRSLAPKKAFFDYHIVAKNFDVKKAYNEIKLFHDLASAAEKAEGIVSLDYQLSGKLDANMYPIYPSLKGGGMLSLEKVKMNGFKLFTAVGKATNRDSINNPDLSKINIKSKIENNIITIDRTKMRVSGFRPRFEGQVSFDGKLNLSGRLGLPPFGILGIPFSVTGTQENPLVKLRRQKDSDKLEETVEDADEDDQ